MVHKLVLKEVVGLGRGALGSFQGNQHMLAASIYAGIRLHYYAIVMRCNK